MMKVISKRLQTVALMVTPGNRVADVGTDHGFVPIWLIKNGISSKVLAMDVRKGPLDRAREHVEKYGLSDYIETRLSDGVEKLQKNEVDTVIIAGMGGQLMANILKEGQDILKTVQELILSPHTDVDKVRRYLKEANWYIKEEKMLLDEGKYYVFLKAVQGENDYSTDIDFIYGKRLLESRTPIFLQYIDSCLKKCLFVQQQLQLQESIVARTRLSQIEEEIRQLEGIANAAIGNKITSEQEK